MIKKRLSITEPVQNFLNSRLPITSSLLLAFSGGPDSLALMHSLIECRRLMGHFEFALAHVDHAWRPESASEAKEIALLAENLGLKLHLKRLDPNSMKGNLEAACREARYEFFGELCREYGYQAVLFGHHADDLAETVLKRALEGVSLPYLSGMSETSHYNGIEVWRPMLSIKKAAILSWLEERGLKGFNDSTNDDPKFMRGRLRTEILPTLRESFGKEISGNLCHIAEEAGELRDYLDGIIEPYLKSVIHSNEGVLLDLSTESPQAIYEIKYLLKRWSRMEGMLLSRQALETVVKHLVQGSSNKRVVSGKFTLEINKKRLLITSGTQARH